MLEQAAQIAAADVSVAGNAGSVPELSLLPRWLGTKKPAFSTYTGRGKTQLSEQRRRRGTSTGMGTSSPCRSQRGGSVKRRTPACPPDPREDFSGIHGSSANMKTRSMRPAQPPQRTRAEQHITFRKGMQDPRLN